jgi:hypothetical protein
MKSERNRRAPAFFRVKRGMAHHLLPVLVLLSGKSLAEKKKPVLTPGEKKGWVFPPLFQGEISHLCREPLG